MTEQRVRVGLVGYGFAGKTFHAPLIRAVAGLHLVAVASSDEKRVRADLPDVAVYPSIEAMMLEGSVDLVVIATPNDTHAPLAKTALAAGKHVVIDKPFALNLNEARELIQIADQAGLVLSVFHNRRWDSDYLSVKTAIEEGAIGRVVHYESRIERFRPSVRDRWRERRGPGSGLWFDLGPHLVDQALQLFGLPDRVSADLANLREGSQTDDWANVRLIYPDKRVVLQCGLLCAGGSPRFLIHGTTGSLLKAGADRQEAQLLDGMSPGEPGWGDDPDPVIRFLSDGERQLSEACPGDQRRFYADLAATISLETPLSVRPVECLAVMAVVEAGLASASGRCDMPLALTSEERAAC